MRPPQTLRQGNRTGAVLHPQLGAETVQSSEELGQVRIRYAREREPVSPTPQGDRAVMVPLLDKLGARLAFDRVSTRIYDAVISKHDAHGSFPEGPSREDLETIREDEHQHVVLARQMIEKIGGDPMVLTPSGNLQLVASRGVLDVVVDPQSDLVACLETVLLAELADHECWTDVIAVAREHGKELVPQCEAAQKTAAEHLMKLRTWLGAARGQMAKTSNPTQRR